MSLGSSGPDVRRSNKPSFNEFFWDHIYSMSGVYFEQRKLAWSSDSPISISKLSFTVRVHIRSNDINFEMEESRICLFCSRCKPETFKGCFGPEELKWYGDLHQLEVFQNITSKCHLFAPCVQECMDALSEAQRMDPCLTAGEVWQR